MTKRERYLKALRNEPVDQLVWAPNFDYWLAVNRAEGTLPEKYREMSRNDIVRSVGGYIWNRAGGIAQEHDASVRIETITESYKRVTIIHTPLGDVRSVHRRTEGEKRSMFLEEHYIKDLESLRVMKYVVEATHYRADKAPVEQAVAETGEDGVILGSAFCVPFIQFAKMDAGYVNGFYLWTDHRKEVDELIDAYFKVFLDGCRASAELPVDVIATGDNMDGVMISPSVFKEYAVPYYTEVKKIAQAKGKLFEGHWCGRTQNLLPFTPGCGLDIVEAIVTSPMADISLAGALDMLKGEVVLQGGVPAVLVCAEGGTMDAFERYFADVVVPLKGRRGFILGMSDNVPPNADFRRVEEIARLIA